MSEQELAAAGRRYLRDGVPPDEQCLKPVDRPAEAADLLGGVVPSR